MATTLTLISSQFVANRPSASRRRLRSLVKATAAVAPPPTIEGGSKSLYEVLQVKDTASVREIKVAYRSLAKQTHPDVAPIGAVDFLEIRQAYETLSDPQQRARYDLEFNRVNRIGFEILGIGYGFGFRFSGSGRMGSRRWETDQCW
ncbi:chaperone protein dnaJ 11 [Carex littledalei]|uniref:Chaperone protein dnaJ 11 n=1 Tax=Carex littledalei TaxID=544730 RepID=A0A833R911_9POAL|nr:chaperone protein dnaJ 11 [Carex littledalei]